MTAFTGWGFAAVGVGAAFGAWLRWFLSVSLNPLVPHVPLGTLVSNLGGGFAVGAALAWFSASEAAPEWRLLIITGFLGGLTTFSTFSAESMMLVRAGSAGWALLHSGVHLLGALLCCFGGYELMRRAL